MASSTVGRVRFGSWTCPISRLDVSDGFCGHAKVLNIFGMCKGMGVKKSAATHHGRRHSEPIEKKYCVVHALFCCSNGATSSHEAISMPSLEGS